MPGATIPGDIGLATDYKTTILASGPELARDRLAVAFGTAKGTYRFNRNVGFPYQKIFALRGSEIALAQSVFTQWLLSFEFIAAVENVRVTYNKRTRAYSIAFEATSRYGRIAETFTFGVVQ